MLSQTKITSLIIILSKNRGITTIEVTDEAAA